MLPKPEGNILPNRHAVEQGRTLEQYPDPGDFRPLLIADPDGFLAPNQDASGIGAEQAGYCLERYRFAGCGGADQDDGFAVCDG